MKNVMLTLVCVGALAVMVAAVDHSELLVKDNFEPDPDTGAGFIEGDPVNLHPEWMLFSGIANVSVVESWSGLQSLRLKAGEPVAHVMRLVPPPSETMARFWVEFRLRPALASEPALTTVSAFGAKIAFSTSPGGPEVWAFDAHNDQAVSSPGISDETGWVHLIVEIDGGNWRLHGFDGPVTAWLGLDGSSLSAIHWFGDSVEDVYLDDLQVIAGGLANPFVGLEEPDSSDKDVEAEAVDETIFILTSTSSTEEAELLDGSTSGGGGFALMSGGGPSVIYVDGNTGSDLDDGESPSTAKETIGAGISAVADGGVVIVAPFSAGYTQSTINPAGKSITIRPSGSIVIR
jgi:hypothetical protein